MDLYITEKQTDKLKFIISGYGNKMMYHRYDATTDSISAGTNLTLDTARSIFKFINGKHDSSVYGFQNLIPENILNFSTDEKFIIWHTPSGEKNILYDEKLPIKSGNYFIPDLIWKLVNNSLQIFAVVGKPTSIDDELYNAPFFNIGTDHSVCMGSANFKTESKSYEEIIKKVEHAFWNSKFTHSSRSQLLMVNFTEYSKEIINKPFKSSDIREYKKLLVKSNKTIKHLMK